MTELRHRVIPKSLPLPEYLLNSSQSSLLRSQSQSHVQDDLKNDDIHKDDGKNDDIHEDDGKKQDTKIVIKGNSKEDKDGNYGNYGEVHEQILRKYTGCTTREYILKYKTLEADNTILSQRVSYLMRQIEKQKSKINELNEELDIRRNYKRDYKRNGRNRRSLCEYIHLLFT